MWHRCFPVPCFLAFKLGAFYNTSLIDSCFRASSCEFPRDREDSGHPQEDWVVSSTLTQHTHTGTHLPLSTSDSAILPGCEEIYCGFFVVVIFFLIPRDRNNLLALMFQWSFANLRALPCVLPPHPNLVTRVVFSRSVPAAAFGLLARYSFIQGCNLSLAVPLPLSCTSWQPWEFKGNRPLWWSTEEYRKLGLWLFSADRNRGTKPCFKRSRQ